MPLDTSDFTSPEFATNVRTVLVRLGKLAEFSYFQGTTVPKINMENLQTGVSTLMAASKHGPANLDPAPLQEILGVLRQANNTLPLLTTHDTIARGLIQGTLANEGFKCIRNPEKREKAFFEAIPTLIHGTERLVERINSRKKLLAPIT